MLTGWVGASVSRAVVVKSGSGSGGYCRVRTRVGSGCRVRTRTRSGLMDVWQVSHGEWGISQEYWQLVVSWG